MADDTEKSSQDGASLESQSTDQPSAEADVGSLERPASSDGKGDDKKAKKEKKAKEKKDRSNTFIGKITKGVNLYLIAFIVVVILALVVTWIAVRNDQNSTNIAIDSEGLSGVITENLLDNESIVGDVTQTLTVEANTIFNGKILIKENLDVAGSINVGGPLTLPGITVSGSSTFDDVEVNNNLSILGNSSVQGSLSVQNGLTVIGSGTFTGNLAADKISANSFELLGDLQVTRHIDAGGSTPTASKGSSIGSGGTISISGTDTAGTVTVNTGSGPGAGSLATVKFTRSFNSTPHVVISAVTADGARVNVYVTRDSTGFVVRAATAPGSSETLVFDYIVIE